MKKIDMIKAIVKEAKLDRGVLSMVIKKSIKKTKDEISNIYMFAKHHPEHINFCIKKLIEK